MTDGHLNGFDYPDFLDKDESPVCAETFPDAFFPDEALEGSKTPNRSKYSHEREAKQICEGCEHRQACLLYALKRPELIGIWGGTTEKDRNKIRRGIPVSLRIPPSRNR